MSRLWFSYRMSSCCGWWQRVCQL